MCRRRRPRRTSPRCRATASARHRAPAAALPAVCTASIQKMIASVCSVRVSDFTIAIEMPKPTAAASAINWPGLISPVAGRTIMTTPTMPERDGGDLPDRHAFAEKHRGENGGPDRHGEFDRHHLADRDQRQRIEPAELRAEMDRVARNVQRQTLRLHHGKAAGAARSADRAGAARCRSGSASAGTR